MCSRSSGGMPIPVLDTERSTQASTVFTDTVILPFRPGTVHVGPQHGAVAHGNVIFEVDLMGGSGYRHFGLFHANDSGFVITLDAISVSRYYRI